MIQNDDMLSINSFNSSMNFAKLQNSINTRQKASNLSESTNYYKSRTKQMQMDSQTSNQGNETLILDDIPRSSLMNIGPVKEASQEDEQSERHDNSILEKD